jgi:hypothetical protein
MAGVAAPLVAVGKQQAIMPEVMQLCAASRLFQGKGIIML